MHVTPLFINLHWLPRATHIKFKALMFAYKTTSGSAPLYLNSLLRTYVPSRSLRSACRFIVPSQRDTKSLSQTFSLNVPCWWNDLPNSIRAAESLAIFKNCQKTLFDSPTLALSILNLFLKKISYLTWSWTIRLRRQQNSVCVLHAQLGMHNDREIIEGNFSLILGSPESWILNPKWRAML